MPEADFRPLESRMDSGVLVLTLTLPELRGEEQTQVVGDELIAAFDGSGAPAVVLDLGRVTYLASLGLTALLRFRRHLQERGGRLLLCNLTPLVAEVLFATFLAERDSSGRMFALAPDVAEALAILGRPALGEGSSPSSL